MRNYAVVFFLACMLAANGCRLFSLNSKKDGEAVAGNVPATGNAGTAPQPGNAVVADAPTAEKPEESTPEPREETRPPEPIELPQYLVAFAAANGVPDYDNMVTKAQNDDSAEALSQIFAFSGNLDGKEAEMQATLLINLRRSLGPESFDSKLIAEEAKVRDAVEELLDWHLTN